VWQRSHPVGEMAGQKEHLTANVACSWKHANRATEQSGDEPGGLGGPAGEESPFLLRFRRVLSYNGRMQINLPNDADKFVLQKAEAAGFGEDVSAYVGHLIAADGPTEDPRGTLSEAEIAASEEMIARGEADIEAGKFRDMKEALLELGEKRGYSLDG